MASRDQLIAAQNSIEDIRRHIGATTLGYLSPDGLARALSAPNDNFCLACFTGDYPIEVPDHVKMSKFALEIPVRNGHGSGHSLPYAPDEAGQVGEMGISGGAEVVSAGSPGVRVEVGGTPGERDGAALNK